MDYKIKFKRLERGKELEENYVPLGNGLQYQAEENASGEVLLSIGVLLGKITSGPVQEAIVPKGKTLEVTFKEE